MFFRKKGIPKKIIYECVEEYEKKDIFLNVDDNYLKEKKYLLDMNTIYPQDFKEFIIKTRGIKYTDFLYNIDFKNKIEKDSSRIDIKFKEYIYVGFNNFSSNSCVNVLKALNEYKDKPFLILDLRNNFGGAVDECIKIANALLPKCEIVNFEYADKRVTYYSNEDYIRFEKIFVFLNEGSASCSEILALSLKLNSKNTYLIGNCSAKKSIGQNTFINRKYRYLFSISTFSWNVNNKNADDLQIFIKRDNINNITYKANDDYIKTAVSI